MIMLEMNNNNRHITRWLVITQLRYPLVFMFLTKRRPKTEKVRSEN
uniref:Uncharacterized protein n=1 Tax=Rhizophora mucronata TaxID=61149 RepID=A0A2P2Q8J7_RHIMU